MGSTQQCVTLRLCGLEKKKNSVNFNIIQVVSLEEYRIQEAKALYLIDKNTACLMCAIMFGVRVMPSTARTQKQRTEVPYAGFRRLLPHSSTVVVVWHTRLGRA